MGERIRAFEERKYGIMKAMWSNIH